MSGFPIIFFTKNTDGANGSMFKVKGNTRQTNMELFGPSYVVYLRVFLLCVFSWTQCRAPGCNLEEVKIAVVEAS